MSVALFVPRENRPRLPGRGGADFDPPLQLIGNLPEVSEGDAVDLQLVIIGGTGDYVSASSVNAPAGTTVTFVEPNIIRIQGVATRPA